ncbi:MAG: hypothetical protein ABR552_02570, partial [Actinomycetota bacterium]
PGAVRELDLSRVVRACAKRSGRMMAVETHGAVPLCAHAGIVEQAIASAMALAHRIADAPVRARAERRNGGGTVKITTASEEIIPANDERVALLHRMVRAEGGRFVIERSDDGTVTLHLTFYSRA